MIFWSAVIVVGIIVYAFIGAAIYGHIERQFLFDFGKNFTDYKKMRIKQDPKKWDEDTTLRGERDAQSWAIFWPFMGLHWLLTKSLLHFKNWVVYRGLDSGNLKKKETSSGGYR